MPSLKNLRLVLWMGLGMAFLVNYQTWIVDDLAKNPPAATASASGVPGTNPATAATSPITDLTAAVPTAAPLAAPAASAVGAPPPAGSPAAVVPGAEGAALPATPSVGPAATTIRVRTDVLDLDLSTTGGVLTRADLLAYPMVKGQSEVVRLLRDQGTGDQYLLQTGLAPSVANAPGSYPTHLATYTSAANNYELAAGVDRLTIPLTWTSAEGVTVSKTFTFKRGSYSVEVDYAINNASPTAWSIAPYAQILHDRPPVKQSYFKVESYAFTGPALYDGTKYDKLDISDSEDAALTRDLTGAWVAALQHHFVTAIAPPRDASHRYTVRATGNAYMASVVAPARTIAAGASDAIKQTLFVGPKLQAQLVSLHPELPRAADYGVLTFLSKPLFWLMKKVHGLFDNWGWTIIAVTFLLKLAFYPLTEASGKSMAKLRLVAPRMKQLQETYKDDREKLGRAMMELYKKEKVNPAAGCLPMLIQMPVFLAFYWVLLESVEMRQAPFMGWIQDLSSRDPWFVLPVINAAAMFMQFKLSPTPTDPVQAKVMMFMPLILSLTFVFFPAGLVLYWVTNTVLSIAQQWNINRRIDKAAATAASARN